MNNGKANDWTESEMREILEWDLDRDGIEMQAQNAMNYIDKDRVELAVDAIVNHFYQSFLQFRNLWISSPEKKQRITKAVLRRIILKSIYLPKEGD